MKIRSLRLAHAITRHVLSAPWFSQATTISCYLSMPTGEVDTSAITEAILASGNHLTASVVSFISTDDQSVFGREEPLRPQGGCYATRGDGLPQAS